MDDLVQFLRDRLDEDAREAEAAGVSWYGYEPERQIAFVPIADSHHIARHSPARVLREVEAKRGLLKRYEEPETSATLSGSFNKLSAGVERYVLIEVFRHLALPYADHPDYREHWRP